MKQVLLSALILISPLSCNQKAEDRQTSYYPEPKSLKTFSTMGKELQVLKKDEETELLRH